MDGDTWCSEGWFTIGAYKTVTVLSGDLDYREYYLFAETYQGTTWDGDYYFLVSDDSFYYDNADKGVNHYQSEGFFVCNAGNSSYMITTLSN